jgi:glycerophosphoryl diester phosphodiesterase
MGNIDKSAAVNGDGLYYQLITKGATVLSSDRSKEAGVQLAKYAKDNKLRSKHIKEVVKK